MRPDPIAALAEAWGQTFKQAQIQDGYRKMRRASGVADSVHDNLAQIAAAKRRVRRSARRAEDERRTARGKWLSGNRAEEGITLAPDGEDIPTGFWDAVASGFAWDDYEAPLPQWKWRSRERRALPGMERPWHCSPKQMLHALSKSLNGRPSRYITMENAYHAWRSAL